MLAATETLRARARRAGRRARGRGRLEAAREDLARAERRRDAGMATDADVLALAVHVADLRSGRIQARGDAAVARAELNRLMGAPIERDVRRSLSRRLADDASARAHRRTRCSPKRTRARPETSAGRRRVSSWRSRRPSGTRTRLLIPQMAAQGAVDFDGTRFDERASAWIAGGELRWTLSLGGAERPRRRGGGRSMAPRPAPRGRGRAPRRTSRS